MTREQLEAWLALEGMRADLIPVAGKAMMEGYKYYHYPGHNDYMMNEHYYVEVAVGSIVPIVDTFVGGFHDPGYEVEWGAGVTQRMERLLEFFRTAKVST